MKIYTVTDDFYGHFVKLFKDDEVKILPREFDRTLEIDLLIFTGGEDVHPSNYNRENPGGSWFNTDRDALELHCIHSVRAKLLRPKKILGVCRGLQVLNVGLGGTLIFDIPTTFGVSHNLIHDIVWNFPNPFSEFLSAVNSMHHQAVEHIGESYPFKIMAREPNTQVIEMMEWANFILGVQFHPEFFRDDDLKERFVATTKDWILGKINLNNPTKFLDPKPTAKAVHGVTVNFTSFDEPVKYNKEYVQFKSAWLDAGPETKESE